MIERNQNPQLLVCRGRYRRQALAALGEACGTDSSLLGPKAVRN